MTTHETNPKVLIVTPEVTYLPQGMGNYSNYLTAKAGGLADVSAALVAALYDLGADVHVAIPDFRSIFCGHISDPLKREIATIRKKLPDEKLHLAEDRSFFYKTSIYSDNSMENARVALAFQREVINNIVPLVQPDLIHCNDWMTALIPAMAREMNIPCLFTIHNIHTLKVNLTFIEDMGIDAAYFWKHLFFQHYPSSYEDIRDGNPVDFLMSGIFASHFVNTVSPAFLQEIVHGKHDFVGGDVRWELSNKYLAGCALGILNSPDPSFHPETDEEIEVRYTPENHFVHKKENKKRLQKTLGLLENEDAPLFFWPHRMDNNQKGCQLLADILYHVVSRYWERCLQVVFVANGEYQHVFRGITDFHGLHDRIAVMDFHEHLARQAYAASDFMLMPSRFEPCGLPQMIAPVYGCLPVAHDTGGIHDTVSHLNIQENTGNGFLFEVYDANGLLWAIDQAMDYFMMDDALRSAQGKRIMEESAARFNHSVTARQYMELYERMLDRPLINVYTF